MGLLTNFQRRRGERKKVAAKKSKNSWPLGVKTVKKHGEFYGSTVDGD
jgi:hypothetical protein